MGLTISILKETAPGETRVAATPDTVKKYVSSGMAVQVESGAGLYAAIPDELFTAAGASVKKDLASVMKGADIVLCVQRPDAARLAALPKGTTLVGLLGPYQFADISPKLAANGNSAVSMELVPRITRAQSMDVLSSQSNLAGYRAVLEAASHYARAFPMMMTAAGTVAPARVFIMGVGVAGLQAIATARRLGAVVSATDVRAATKEQVQSLGATFVMVEDEESKAAETSGGYAKEMSDAYKAKQAALIADTIRKQDIVITTALIPGRPAPVLVTEDMVKTMKPGSVIIDMAVAQGGNCPLSRNGEIVSVNNVSIIGHANLAGAVAADSSALYAKNLSNFLALLVKDGAIAFNFEDEIIKGVTLLHDGNAVHPLLASAPAASAAAPKPESAPRKKSPPEKKA